MLPTFNRQRALSLVTGLVALAAAIHFLRLAPEFGITPLVFGLISLGTAVVQLCRFRGKDISISETPRSLQIVTRIYAILLGLFWIAGVAGMALEWRPSSFVDFIAIIGIATLSVIVWGAVVFLLVILPLWGVGRLLPGPGTIVAGSLFESEGPVVRSKFFLVIFFAQCANLFAYFVIIGFFDGSAFPSGEIAGDRYFVISQGNVTEVSRSWFYATFWHGLLVWTAQIIVIAIGSVDALVWRWRKTRDYSYALGAVAVTVLGVLWVALSVLEAFRVVG